MMSSVIEYLDQEEERYSTDLIPVSEIPLPPSPTNIPHVSDEEPMSKSMANSEHRKDSRKRVRISPFPPEEIPVTFNGHPNHYFGPQGSQWGHDLFGGIIITRPQIKPADFDTFFTYAFNPQIVTDWLGMRPLKRISDSLQAQPLKVPSLHQHKVLHDVNELTVRNLRSQLLVDSEKRGFSSHGWNEPGSGNEFKIWTSTWTAPR